MLSQPGRATLLRVAAALVTGSLLAAVGYCAMLGWLIYKDLDEVDRVAVVVPEEGRPAALPAERVGEQTRRPLTFVLAGVDKDFTGQVEPGEFVEGAQRADTILVAHLAADRKSASLISIPRDTLVDIPGHGLDKVNAAYSYGGPSLLVQTVESFTGLRTDHLVVVDWAGFKSLTDALGGVTVTIPETVEDPYQNRVWTKGTVTLDGADALAYVRQRHGLPRGDLDRIARQQNFLRLLLAKFLEEGLSSPLAAATTVNSLVRYMTVDDTLGVRSMAALAWDLRGLRVKDVAFATMPMDRFDYHNSQSVIIPDRQRFEGLVQALRAGTMRDWLRANPTQALPRPTQVS